MRHTISLAPLLALITVSTVRATEWCGFIDKEHAQVHCGYSSVEQCKQAIGNKKDPFADAKRPHEIRANAPTLWAALK